MVIAITHKRRCKKGNDAFFVSAAAKKSQAQSATRKIQVKHKANFCGRGIKSPGKRRRRREGVNSAG